MAPMDGRPPLAVSPRRLRPRRNLSTVAPSDLTPPVFPKIKTPVRLRSSLPCEKLMRPEYELMKEDADVGSVPTISSSSVAFSSPLFERGRLYEAYSARRNERLKRKQEMMMMVMMDDEDVVGHDPEVAVELAKRRYVKKAESVRKSVPVNFSVSRGSGIRSSLRSSKEMKKGSYQKSAVVDSGKWIGIRSVRRG